MHIALTLRGTPSGLLTLKTSVFVAATTAQRNGEMEASSFKEMGDSSTLENVFL